MPRTRAAQATLTPRWVLAASLVAMSLASGCAAGQQAATRLVGSSVDGTNASVGDLAIRFAHIDIDAAEAATGKVYVSVFNAGGAGDELVSVTSPAGKVAFAGSPVALPALVRVDLLATSGSTPAAATLVITGTEKLRRGTSVPLVLVFARAGTLTLSVPVQVPAERAPLNEKYKGVFDHEGE